MQIPETIPTTTETLLVGYDFTNGKDKSVLIVGGKSKGVDVKVINAFQGKEANDIYERLVTKKEKDADKTDAQSKIQNAYTHSRVWNAYHQLVNTLHAKNSTEDDLRIAMDSAIGYLGEVLND